MRNQEWCQTIKQKIKVYKVKKSIQNKSKQLENTRLCVKNNISVCKTTYKFNINQYFLNINIIIYPMFKLFYLSIIVRVIWYSAMVSLPYSEQLCCLWYQVQG